MHRSATRQDFHQLSPEVQLAYATVLYACAAHKLSVRCEVIDNREFSMIVAPGMSAARFWIDKLDVDSPPMT